MRSKVGVGSTDYANLFYKVHEIFRSTTSNHEPIIIANFILWVVNVLTVRNLITRYGDQKDKNANDYLHKASLIFSSRNSYEVKEALKYFVRNSLGHSFPGEVTSFVDRFVDDLKDDSASHLAGILGGFNFDSENNAKILSAARGFISVDKRSELPVSEYLMQLVAQLSFYEGERANALNLFTEISPLIPPAPYDSKRKTYLHTRSSIMFIFLSLCRSLGEKYDEIFHSDALALLAAEKDRFHSVFAMLPFGSKLSEQQLQFFPGAAEYGNKAELVYIDTITQQLSSKGLAFLVLSQSILLSNGKNDVMLRSRLVERDLVEAVIFLPKVFLPQSGLNPCLVILNKTKDEEDKGKVYFIDTTAGIADKQSGKGIHPEDVWELISNKPQGNSFKTVSIEEIIENNCSLIPSRYISPVESELRNFEADGVELAPLSSILTEAKIPSEQNNLQFPFVKIANLRNSETEFQITDKDLVYIEPSAQRGVVTREKLLLTAKVGENLKPTLLNLSNNTVCLSSNVASFRINEEKILPDFLISELHSDFFKKQFASILGGAAQPTWKPKSFLELTIRVPSIEQQHRTLREKLEILHRLKQSEADKLKEKLQYKETEFSIISSVRHSLASQFGGFRTDIESLHKLLSSVIEKGESLTWLTALTPQTNIADIFVRMNGKILDAEVTFDKIKGLIELNRRDLNFERTDLGDFIIQCVKEFNYSPADLEFAIGLGAKRNLPVMAEIDRFLVKELLRNLVENSFHHAKKEGEVLRIFIAVDGNPAEQKMLILDYRDFGKGLPEGFTYADYFSFGNRSGANQGSGIGGYIVRQIVERHSGTIKPVEKSDTELSSFGLSISIPFNQIIE